MLYICHRVNTVNELENVPMECGVEIDLRDDLEGNVYISHDPFIKGEFFRDYLRHYSSHKTLILNIKSEGIEWKVQGILREFGITDYFFLDSSFPMIYQMIKSGEKNIALRISEYECIENVKRLVGRISWIWLDCFTDIPIDCRTAQELHLLGYKLCFVSPELQGRPEDIEKYAGRLADMKINAICTKQHNLKKWKLLGL